ncbi:MAG: amidohydrolase family protein [Thermoplasmata archaeon]
MSASGAPRSIRFQNALIVTQDARRRVFEGDLRFEDGRITHVGPEPAPEAERTVPAGRFVIAPGFINTHGHVAMSPLRGIADDRDLGQFLEKLFRLDARRTEEDLEAGAFLGIAEMLMSGTTSFLDLYYGEDAVARAVERMGIRGFLGWAVLDPELTTQKGRPLDNAREFIGRWKGHPQVTPLVAPQGVYVCNAESWIGAAELAEATGTFVHCHLSETRREVHEHEAKYGIRPVGWLDSIGALRPGMVAAHGVWLNAAEIRLLGERKVGVAHCPSSNMKLATGGVCPVPELQRAGVTVGLGTDSAASNNSLSMLREMHLAGLLQKHHRWDASVLPAQELLDLATRCGAQLVGRPDDLGALEVGRQADLVLYRRDHPTLLPARPEAIVSHLAYAASEEAVDSVYVGGREVLRARELVGRPWAEIHRAAQALTDRLWAEG